MAISVIVPQIGQSIAEATIVKWFKKPGDRIEKGEVLVEIGTDKINTEIPAPETGVVEKLLVAEGETVPVETEIAVLSRDEQPDRNAPEKPQASLSPLVRKMAREHGIDLEGLTGSGAGGRVTKEDLERIIGERRKDKPAESPAAGEDERVPMSRMRKLIADHMLQSVRTAAGLTTFFEIDVGEVELRRKETAGKLTYLPFIVAAVAKALRAFPILNVSIDGHDIVYHKEVNIGIAVAVEDGLMVPVIRRADQKNVRELAQAANDLSERARNKQLSPDELQNGTFTITNPGVFGALMGTPIIYQPQVAILGVGAVVKRAVVINDAVAVRPMSYFSLTYDHRALDGATADRFLAHVKNTLEKECPPA